MAPKIHILAPVHNRRAVTEKFLQRLLAQTYENWHLILIDDGSTDGTAAMAKAMLAGRALTVLTGRGHWWWGGSLHQAYLWLKRHRPADNDLVVTMNDDTEFDTGFFAKAVKAIKPSSLLLAQTHHRRGGLDEVGVAWDWPALRAFGVTDPKLVTCCSTRGLFLYAGDFLGLKGFHPLLLPHYLSDYEFSIRALRHGLSFISADDVILRFDDDKALTGIRSTEGHSPFRRLKLNLSIRSTDNPVYWTFFLLMACPLRHVPANILRVWWRYFAPLRKSARQGQLSIR